METNHPILVYEALARDIRGMGINTVFGLMSDDTALFIATLDAQGVRFVGARHESVAAAMAEGYAAATGMLGIAVLGRGPATANSLHGATYACRTGSRVLLVYGHGPTVPPPANGFGPDTKTLDGPAVLNAAGIRTFVAQTAEGARSTLAAAVAASARGGVALLLPADVQRAKLIYEDSEPMPPTPSPAAHPPRAAAIEIACRTLTALQRPLLIAGAGAYRAGAADSMLRLADKIGAVLATTVKAKDMFRGHAYDCGVMGSFSHAAGRRFMEQADGVVAVGASLNLRTTVSGTALPADVPLIQVDALRSNIGSWCHADVAVVGDARLSVEAICAGLPDRALAEKPFHCEATRRHLAAPEPAREFEPKHTPRTLDPRTLAAALDRMLPQQRNIVCDAGNFLQVVTYLSVPSPAHFKMSSDFASVGMGFGTAMGFAIGRPREVTVLFIGDGGFTMTMGEIETVAREGIPLVIVLMNDCAYGAERHFLEMRDMPGATAMHPDVDYAPIAAALGFEAGTVRTMEQLQALSPVLAAPTGPIFLDCKINGAVVAPFHLEALAVERAKR